MNNRKSLRQNQRINGDLYPKGNLFYIILKLKKAGLEPFGEVRERFLSSTSLDERSIFKNEILNVLNKKSQKMRKK
jgi:hypothetical protein